jgi:hypothetical protein
MNRSTQFVVLIGSLLLLGRVVACQTDDRAAIATGGAGRDGGTGLGAQGGLGGDGVGGQTGGGLTTGESGSGGSCGLFDTCDGNDVVVQTLSNAPNCSQPFVTLSRTPCPTGQVCFEGSCLPPVAAPTMACSSATDCTLPPSVCVEESRLMVFSDPTCDQGQCHWKQIVDDCNPNFGIRCHNGQCYDPGMMTRGPITPMPTEAPGQPPPPPAQSCAKTADCAQPAPGCFSYSTVTYVNPACRAGTCVWEYDLTVCTNGCGDGGTCATP